MDKNTYYNFLLLNYFLTFHFQAINIYGMKHIFNEISFFLTQKLYIFLIDKLFNYYIFNLIQYLKYNYKKYCFNIYLNIIKYR